jgi:hypothetical protein
VRFTCENQKENVVYREIDKLFELFEKINRTYLDKQYSGSAAPEHIESAVNLACEARGGMSNFDLLRCILERVETLQARLEVNTLKNICGAEAKGLDGPAPPNQGKPCSA